MKQLKEGAEHLHTLRAMSHPLFVDWILDRRPTCTVPQTRVYPAELGRYLPGGDLAAVAGGRCLQQLAAPAIEQRRLHNTKACNGLF